MLPTLASASTCARFCPKLFKRSRPESTKSFKENSPGGSADATPARPASVDQPCGTGTPMQLPYKLVFAVGTTDSVFIYDTGARALPPWHVGDCSHTPRRLQFAADAACLLSQTMWHQHLIKAQAGMLPSETHDQNRVCRGCEALVCDWRCAPEACD
jgi:hypothetical protein